MIQLRDVPMNDNHMNDIMKQFQNIAGLIATPQHMRVESGLWDDIQRLADKYVMEATLDQAQLNQMYVITKIDRDNQYFISEGFVPGAIVTVTERDNGGIKVEHAGKAYGMQPDLAKDFTVCKLPEVY